MVLIESLGAPKVILGGLDLYKPSASGLVSDAPNPLVEWNLNKMEKRIEEWTFIANSLL
jgi:hypothetical protein